MKNNNFPKLEKEQFVLGQVEATTGIVYNLEGTYFHQNSGQEKYMIFESIEKAKSYVMMQDKTNIEFFVWNSEEELVYHKEVHHKEIYLEKVEISKKAWRKFWQ